MLRFFKDLFSKKPSLDYQSIDDPKTFPKPVDGEPAKEPNLVDRDMKASLLTKAPEGQKR